MIIFQDKLTQDPSQTQLSFVAQGYTPRYRMDSSSLGNRHYVSIIDERGSQTIYEAEFASKDAADKFEDAMREEINYWDVEDYYHPHPYYEAVEDLQKGWNL